MTPGERHLQVLKEMLAMTPEVPDPLDLTELREIVRRRERLMEGLSALKGFDLPPEIEEQAKELVQKILQKDRRLIAELTRVRKKMLAVMRRTGPYHNTQPRLVSLRG